MARPILTDLDFDGNKATNLDTPTADADAATKKYVDDTDVATRSYTDTEIASAVALRIPFALIDAVGDLIVGDAPNSATRLPQGANGTVLGVSGGVLGYLNPSGLVDHGGTTGLADDDHAQYLLVDGTRPMAGTLDMDGNNLVTNGGDVRLDGGGILRGYRVSRISKSDAAFRIAEAESGYVIECTNATSCAITIPSQVDEDIPVGSVYEILNLTGGDVGFFSDLLSDPGDRAVINSPNDDRTITVQYGAVVLRKRGGNVWHLEGRLSAP